MIKQYLCVPAIALLSACGGGSTSNTPLPSVSGIDAIKAETTRLENMAQTLDVTPASSAALSGRADFEGVLALGIHSEFSHGIGMGGDLTVSIDFETGELSGDANNFFSREGDAVEGSLTLSDGQTDEVDDGVLLTADLAGSLEVYGVMRSMDGILIGTSAGDNGELIAGLVAVEYEYQLPAGGPIVPSRLEGGFLAERQ